MIFEYSRSFKKDYKKLSQKIKAAFGVRVEMFILDQHNPILNNHAIHNPYDGSRSINISGDIRAIYEIDENTVTFIRIGSHSELYK